MSKVTLLKRLDHEQDVEDLKDIASEVDTFLERLLWIGTAYKGTVVALLSLILWRVW